MSSSKPTPTVLYDTERPPSTPLDPPDVPHLLSARRHRLGLSGWRPRLSLELPRRAQVVVTCATIGLSAVQANGVYCWATYGPVVARQLDLTAAEAQTIVVGGILGVYLCAAPIGSLSDRLGPRFASLFSAALAAIGYLGFAAVLRLERPPDKVYLWLTAAYAFVGAATIGSYFAALTCASLSFPSHPTLSLSLPLALIGLSSLVLSAFSALPAFHTASSDLDAAKFLTFLGILSPAVNLLSAGFMRVLRPLSTDTINGDDDADGARPSDVAPAPNSGATDREATAGERGLEVPGSPMSALLHLDEHTPLLIGGPEAARADAEAHETGAAVDWTALALVRDRGFWVFGILLTLCIGPAETIMASIGSILTSLLPEETKVGGHALGADWSGAAKTFWDASTPFASLGTASSTAYAAAAPNPLALRNKHVFLLSLSSTLARLFVGFTADRLAPPPTAHANPAAATDPGAPPHVFVQEHKVALRRSAYAAICAASLGAVCAWNAGMLTGEGGFWVLSVGTGAMYGALFTLTPAIVSAHFGPTSFGLAWGMVSYFPALGSVVFSYVYATLQVLAAPDGGACAGPQCFQTTLAVSAACCALAAIGIWAVGRTWRL